MLYFIPEVSHPMKTLLIVDDDAEDLRLAKEALDGHGYRVLCFSDSEKALEQVEREKPDLMILDVIMPKIDGPSLAYQLHNQPATSDIAFIFLTSATFGLRTVFPMGEVTYEVLGKPIKKLQLLKTIQQVLSAQATHK